MPSLESFQHSNPAPVLQESQRPFQFTDRFYELMAKIPSRNDSNMSQRKVKKTGVRSNEEGDK